MSTNTAIEWADHTFNPWIGCTKVSPACDHCYAEADFAHRRKVVQWGAGQPRKRTAPSTWAQPLKWNREAERLGIRYRVFCASLADVFDNEVPVEWRQRLMSLVADTPNLDWLFLTKRIGNACKMLSDASMHDSRLLTAEDHYRQPDNLWLGATICNQAEADRDIPKLLDTPAAKRFLSMEPLLGPVDLTGEFLAAKLGSYPFRGLPSEHRTKLIDMLDWVIVGGESGHGARPMHPDWARSLRDQCQAAGVPFLFKQWGEWAPREEWSFHISHSKQCAIKIDGTEVSDDDVPQDVGGQRFELVGKKAAGRLLDGREWNEVPA